MKLINVMRFLKPNIVLYILISFIFLINLYIAASYLRLGDVMFNTDVARDFLITREMVQDHKLSLIGARAGGIPGMFYSPLWNYINLPVFILSHGNPVATGYFMICLVFAYLISYFFITKKIFGSRTAVFASIILSLNSINYGRSIMPWFGAFALSPVFFYLIYLFLTQKKVFHLFLALVTNGLLICFQPFFGGLIFILTLFFILYYFISEKKAAYLLVLPTLLIPLFTYILFDIKHNFLQLRALYAYLSTGTVSLDNNLFVILQNKLDQFLGSINLLGNPSILNYVIFFALVFYPLYHVISKKISSRKYLTFYKLFYVYFIGFWVLTIFFKGYVWNYYHAAFYPILILVFCSFSKLKKVGFIYTLVTLWIMITLIFRNILTPTGINNGFTGIDGSSWYLNYKVANEIFTENKGQFGYFVYSPSEFGYSIRYAMEYTSRVYRSRANICRKMETTYLIYEPFKADLNEYKFWREKRINIYKKPISSRNIGQLLVEKYRLDREEQDESFDHNIICDLHFR